MELDKTYTPANLEAKWYDIWDKAGYFQPTFTSDAPNYCIMLPPPNVTGTLHMGHGFQHTIIDILIRYHRMQGYNTLWQPGVDHAGIATQIIVEQQLLQSGTSRQEQGRDEFVKHVWQWKNQSGNIITSQMRRLGASCDWTRERFTMDDGLSHAVAKVFVDLYNKGYIYKGTRLVNWDVKLQTAVSDLEVEAVQEDGHLWSIDYPIKDSCDKITIATTRPETMLADVAVAVHPDDPRFQHLIGKYVSLPLQNREIPIIADSYVDQEFGIGCVKITPGHDFNDYVVGQRHKLPIINILTLDGHINDNAPLAYQGLERMQARAKIIKDLQKLNLLASIQPHKLMLPRSTRTGSIIEPLLTTQWYMAMDKLAQNALELVHTGQIKFIPDNWENTYSQWLNNIQDWCLSRQLWWGHRIPAYYDKQGKCYVAMNLTEAIKMAGTDDLHQDPDVLDTWFSSGLWSFSTLGWPNSTAELATFLPSNVLVTGFDIIFFWVARMIMLTYECTQQIPFKEVYVHGLIQDAHGNKMSKSKGNVIDPIDLIDGINANDLVQKRTSHLMNPKQISSIKQQTLKDYPQGFDASGADALRFTFATLATGGKEISFDVRRLESSRNFCNKIWNATRFVLMNISTHQSAIGKTAQLSFIDQWIMYKHRQLIESMQSLYAIYRFDMIAHKIYEFLWNEYCDWYVELAKLNLNNANPTVQIGTVNTLLHVLESSLRMLHPIMPFITEELWQQLSKVGAFEHRESIMISKYPNVADIANIDEASMPMIEQVDVLKQIVVQLRNLRTTMNLNPGLKVPMVIELDKTRVNEDILQQLLPYIESLAKIKHTQIIHGSRDNQKSNSVEQNLYPHVLCASMRFTLQVEINSDVEKLRIERAMAKHHSDIDKIKQKLNNSDFMQRAPQDLVVREQNRLDELNNLLVQLNQQLQQLKH